MILLSLFLLFLTTSSAIPTPTPTPTPTITTPPTTTTRTCPPGSTLHTTTDCTLGIPITLCHSPVPRTTHCPPNSFPGVWHPGHCIEAPTCYPVDAPWITTSCSNGAVPWRTSTLFEGVLEGEVTSTTISVVSCSCATDKWYSMTLLPGSSLVDTFCMPSSNCPSGMTSSTSTNEYCLTSSAQCASQSVPPTTVMCRCEGPSQTAVYPTEVGGAATGCAAV